MKFRKPCLWDASTCFLPQKGLHVCSNGQIAIKEYSVTGWDWSFMENTVIVCKELVCKMLYDSLVENVVLEA